MAGVGARAEGRVRCILTRMRSRTWPYPRHRRFVKTLREAAAKWFGARGYVTHPSKPYCLSRREEWSKNLVLHEVAVYVEAEKRRCAQLSRPFPLHKDLHHGLSSQAHAFNLIGPLVVREDLQPLREALGAHGIAWPNGTATASFEFEDREVFHETSGQPTSIAVVVKGGDGLPTIFIEHKLTEPEFGGCTVFEAGDCDGRSPARDHGLCYLHHIGRRYWGQMDHFGFSRLAAAAASCPFAAHCQFFREVLLALVKGGTFVLLHDERSPVFHVKPAQAAAGPDRGLIPVLLELVPEEHRSRIVSVTVQELVTAVRASGRHKDWLGSYCEKYAVG